MDAQDRKIAALEKQVLELKRMIQQLDVRGRQTAQQLDRVKHVAKRNTNTIDAIASKLNR